MADGEVIARPWAPPNLHVVEREASQARTAPGFWLVYQQGAANVHSCTSYSRAITKRKELAHANPGRIIWICAPDKGLIVELTEHEVHAEPGGGE